MVSEISRNYKALVGMIPELIEVSGYRNDYLSRKMGLSPATFSAKKKRSTWSVDDVEKLMTIIENEDVDDFMMVKIMEAAKDDETISAEEFRKEIARWK